MIIVGIRGLDVSVPLLLSSQTNSRTFSTLSFRKALAAHNSLAEISPSQPDIIRKKKRSSSSSRSIAGSSRSNSTEYVYVSRYPDDNKFYVGHRQINVNKSNHSEYDASLSLKEEEIIFSCRRLFPSHDNWCTIALMSMVGIHRVRGGNFVTKEGKDFTTRDVTRAQTAFVKHSVGCYHCKQQLHLTYQCEEYNRVDDKDSLMLNYLRQACLPLNPEQISAVTSPSPTTMVLAGAGSGKTKVIVHRIAWLICMGYSPQSIFATTFTNKVAAELKERIELLSPRAPQSIGTFHGLALQVLIQNSVAASLSHKYQIIDEDFQKQIVKSILKKENMPTTETAMIVSFINRCKDECLRSCDVLKKRSHVPMHGSVYREYEEICLNNNYLDFGEILLRTCELLSNNQEVRLQCQKQYSHFLVDEFQDTNSVQYKILTLLYGSMPAMEEPTNKKSKKKKESAADDGHRSLFVVGDDDQAIYGFRGASSAIMQRFFWTDFPKSKIVKLERNYRSTRVILAAANAVIQKNQHRIGKTLWTDKDNHLYKDILMIKSRDDLEEADEIADIILSKTENSEFRFRDILITYRTKMQARALERACIRYKIPYKIKGGTLFLDREEIKHLMAYIRLLFNRKDDVSFARIVNTPARGISEATVSKMKMYATRRDLSLWAAAEEIAGQDDRDRNHDISSKATLSIRSFVNMIQSIADGCSHLQPKEALELILLQSDLLLYYQNLATTSAQKDDDESESDTNKRLDNINELLLLAEQYNFETSLSSPSAETDEVVNLRPPILQFMNDLTLSSNDNVVDSGEGEDILVKKDAKKEEDCVQLMTIHAAKGLEFPLVFVAGLAEGILPFPLAEEDEERRLLYVALTRAREQLVLSYYVSRWRQPMRPSRFIQELPPVLLKNVYNLLESNKPPGFGRYK